jgi:hypothetical protein
MNEWMNEWGLRPLSCSRVVFEAKMGEIMVSCEKIRYTIRTAEDYLKPEPRGVWLLCEFTSFFLLFYLF